MRLDATVLVVRMEPSTTEKASHIIFQAVGKHNQRVSEDQRLELSADTVLFGADGTLDSLQFVSLIVAIEEMVEEEFELQVVLADERTLNRTPSPFQTLGSLAAYVSELIEEEDLGQ